MATKKKTQTIKFAVKISADGEYSVWGSDGYINVSELVEDDYNCSHYVGNVMAYEFEIPMPQASLSVTKLKAA